MLYGMETVATTVAMKTGGKDGREKQVGKLWAIPINLNFLKRYR